VAGDGGAPLAAGQFNNNSLSPHLRVWLELFEGAAGWTPLDSLRMQGILPASPVMAQQHLAIQAQQPGYQVPGFGSGSYLSGAVAASSAAAGPDYGVPGGSCSAGEECARRMSCKISGICD
jgi:hypothetical protein